VCSSACPSGIATCGGMCADIRVDNSNCGRCGHACPSNSSCMDFMCYCNRGFNVCRGMCANYLTDHANCGACERACASDETCVAGHCV
jgi:hypothetical protein